MEQTATTTDIQPVVEALLGSSGAWAQTFLGPKELLQFKHLSVLCYKEQEQGKLINDMLATKEMNGYWCPKPLYAC